MKKLIFISTLFFILVSSCCKVNAQQQSGEFTIQGETLEIYKWSGVDYIFTEKVKMDIDLYFNWQTETSFFMVVVNSYPENLGLLAPTEFYTSKNKLIPAKNLDKMKEKGKLDHYILNSIQCIDNSTYNFYVPNSIFTKGEGVVIFMKTLNNQSEMYKFKVKSWYNGKPEIPQNLNREVK